MPPAAALEIGLANALAFRLGRHHLVEPAPDPLAAAATLLGAQAQVHSAGVLQLRARAGRFGDDRARAALLGDRTLVKLWAQRSTLHLVPTADVGLTVALRRHAEPGYRRWYASGGLSEAQIDRLAEAIREALGDGPASRADLAARIAPRLGEWARPWLEHSWGGAIKLVVAQGHACHGPERDREATFVRLDRWVAPPEVPAPEAALSAFLRRYLAAYGPAAPADFAKFTGLGAEPVRAAFRGLAGETIPVAVAGRRAWALAEDEPALRLAEPPPGHVAVLPLFDPWLLAHADTAQTVAPVHRAAVYRTAGWISAVVLKQGRVAATWSHRRRGDRWEVALAPLARLSKGDRRRIESRLRRLADGLEVAVREAEPRPE